jgi:hypothetical protein
MAAPHLGQNWPSTGLPQLEQKAMTLSFAGAMAPWNWSALRVAGLLNFQKN